MNRDHMRHQLLTQDNRCTWHPIFLVEREVWIYGLDTGYTDDVAWIHDGAAVDDEVSAKLEQAYWDDEDTCKIDDDLEINLDDCERVGVYKYWEFMQPFFTHEAAQAFIDCHGEKYDGELRIMVDSAYRNPEWQFIRKMFMEEEGATK